MSESVRKVKTAPPAAPVLVKFENVTKSFGSFRALDQVSLEIRQGDIVGLLGPNGAGKTTAMRVLSGYFAPTSGKVWISGRNMSGCPEKAKKLVGYLPETVHLYGDMSVLEFLDFAARVKGVRSAERNKRVEEILYLCGIWDVRRRLIGQLSKGYKQ
nr:ABC transporter ATP-binding protein [Candidatus Omnitrophota bacterium]